MLLTNTEFSILIAGRYLKRNYEYALKKGKWNPYYKTISRYNGGWNNTTYYKRVMKRMKHVNRLIAKGII